VKKCFLVLLFFYGISCWSQDTVSVGKLNADTIPANSNRQWLVGGLTVAGYGGSFAFLSTAWYKDFPRRSFHTFNDNGEWLQVDKVGHTWTTYHTSRLTTNLWQWAGVADKKAVIYGTGTSFLYMLSIEYLDGHSVEWGWSWGDVGANFVGAALFAGQELGWQEQKVGLKFSSHYKDYRERQLIDRANDLYGRGNTAAFLPGQAPQRL